MPRTMFRGLGAAGAEVELGTGGRGRIRGCSACLDFHSGVVKER